MPEVFRIQVSGRSNIEFLPWFWPDFYFVWFGLRDTRISLAPTTRSWTCECDSFNPPTSSLPHYLSLLSVRHVCFSTHEYRYHSLNYSIITRHASRLFLLTCRLLGFPLRLLNVFPQPENTDSSRNTPNFCEDFTHYCLLLYCRMFKVR